MLDLTTCTKTVSIFEAVIFGANGACIDISLSSLLGGIAMFATAVIVLRYVGSRLLHRLLGLDRPKTAAPGPEPKDDRPHDTEAGLTPLPYESPIKSTGAWGGRPL